MPDFSEFIVNHWMLVSLLTVLIGVFAGMEFIEKALGLPQLKPQEVVDLINHQDGVIIDIRSDADFRKGHIANAVNVPRSDLPERMDKIEPYREKPIILVCTLGRSVMPVGKQMRKDGFKHVVCLGGGMTRWLTDNLPVVKG